MKNYGHSMKWKGLAVNRMLSGLIKRRANTSFTIVQRKALKAAEVFVTTAKRWSRGKNINPNIMLLIWLPAWASSVYRKNNTGSCRSLEISIRKHRAG